MNISETNSSQENISTLRNASFDSNNAGTETYVPSWNMLALGMSVISILFLVFALRILAMCKKTASQITYLSINFLMSYIVFEASVSLHTAAMSMFGDKYYVLIFNSRVFCSAVFVTTIWGSVCAASVDRALALTFPFDYPKHVTKSVLRSAIIVIWFLNVAVPVSTILITIAMLCGQYSDLSKCDTYAVLRPMKLCLSGLLILYAVFIVVACKIIHSIALSHKSNLDKFTANQKYLSNVTKCQKNSKTTRSLLLVIIEFIVFHLPVFFHLTVFGYIPQLQTHNLRM